jgi:biopolymer transport protein ExbD
MPRVKVARKSTFIDMTAMCDVAFLLLTFFILTAKPKVDDPTKAEIPFSSKTTPVPEDNLATITVGNINGKSTIFYSVTGADVRTETLKAMGDKYKVSFTPEEISRFSLLEVFGVPIANLKQYLDLRPDERKGFPTAGIPADTTAANELGDWIYLSRQAERGLHNRDLDIAIKGDRKQEYPVINEIISILGHQKKFKFDLITDLRAAPKK